MALKRKRTEIGERLRSALEAKGMRHSWVASEAGITPATLSNILTGRTSDPSLSVVLAIAEVIGEPLSALLGERPESLLESEREVLRQAIDILERRVVRQRRVPAIAASAFSYSAEVDSLPRHEIPAAMFRRGARMVFRASGDSMAEEGIRDGDILYVKPTTDLRVATGRVAVCRVEESLYLRKLVATGRGIRLQAGSAYPDVHVRDRDSLQIVGVVVAHLGEL